MTLLPPPIPPPPLGKSPVYWDLRRMWMAQTEIAFTRVSDPWERRQHVANLYEGSHAQREHRLATSFKL